MPRPSNWKKLEEEAHSNGEFAQHEVDDPAIDTDSVKSKSDRRRQRVLDDHGKTPKQAALAKQSESPSIASYNIQARALRKKNRNELRAISAELKAALQANDVEPGDLAGTSNDELVSQILKERQRLNRNLRLAASK